MINLENLIDKTLLKKFKDKMVELINKKADKSHKHAVSDITDFPDISGGSYDGPSWNWNEYDKAWEMDASNSVLLVKSIDTWNGAFLGHPDGSGIRAGIDGNYMPESMTGHPMNIFVQADEPIGMSEGDIWLKVDE